MSRLEDMATVRRPSFPHALAVLLALALGLGAVGPTPIATAEPTFAVNGEGYGHGVGMSQWGARGMAEQGHSAAAILGHYYQGTTVTGGGESDDVRVLVGIHGSFTLTTGGPGTIWGVGAVGGGAVLTVSRSGNSIVLGGAVNATLGGSVVVDPGGSPLLVSPLGHRYRRGLLSIGLDGGGGLRAIVVGLSMNSYLRGIGEVPSSWPAEALKAQAIAARTYSQAKLNRADRWSSDFDVSASIDGAYIGDDKEFGPMGDRWNAAVDATNGQFVTYGGGLISVVYSASSGGHTENSEAVWGSPLPYLRGVPDPADALGGNPHSSWTATFSGGQLGAKLGMGTVTSVQAGAAPGVSGRLDRATVTFTDAGGATRSFTGAQLRSLLGLKSTKFTIGGAGGPAPARLRPTPACCRSGCSTPPSPTSARPCWWVAGPSTPTDRPSSTSPTRSTAAPRCAAPCPATGTSSTPGTRPRAPTPCACRCSTTPRGSRSASVAATSSSSDAVRRHPLTKSASEQPAGALTGSQRATPPPGSCTTKPVVGSAA